MAGKTFFKRITKIFAIIAVMVAIGLCALLVGCGTPRDTDNTEEPKVGVDNSNTNIDTDISGTGNNEMEPYSSHFIASSLESEYDVDNFVIPMSYACDTKSYPLRSFRRNSEIKVSDYQICIFADKEPYDKRYKQYNFELFNGMQSGEVNGNIYMIERLSFPKTEDGLVDMSVVDNAINSNFDYHYNLDKEYFFFDHNLTIKIPREYFDDSGTIYFNVQYLYKYSDSSSKEFARSRGQTEFYPRFEYSLEDNKVKLTNFNNFADDRFKAFIEDNKVRLSRINNTVDEIKPYDTEENINKSTMVMKSKSTEREVAEINKSELVDKQILQTADNVISKGVKGRITWEGKSYLPYKKYSAKQVRVEAFDKSTQKSLGITYTDVNGDYSIDFETPDIKNDNVYITLTLDGIYAEVTNASNETYTYTPNIDLPDYEGAKTVINEQFDMETLFGQALQIYQAVVTAARYAEEMNNEQALPSVYVIYPKTNIYRCNYTWTQNGEYFINIVDSTSISLQTYEAWDVIMHEYGHHAQHILKLTNSLGGGHMHFHNLADHFYEDSIDKHCFFHGTTFMEKKYVKINSLTLTWGEAWATYFAFTAQKYYDGEIGDLKTCCNASYESSGHSTFDYEECKCDCHDDSFHNLGEASEEAIIGILWDLFDIGTNEDFDKISISSKTLWDIEVNSHAVTLSEFIGYLQAHINDYLKENDKYNENDLAKLLDYYELSAGNLAVEQYSCPTKFTWSARGGDTDYYPNNKFDFKLYDANTGDLLISQYGISETSYKLTELEWSNLVQRGCDFYWTVDAYQSDENYGGECITGPYKSIKAYVNHTKINTGKTLAYNTLTTGSFGANCIAIYNFASSGYLNALITITSNIPLRMDFYHLGDSLDGDGCIVKTGTNISFIEELVSGGSTVYIKISSPNGSGGTFTIKIESHSHSYSGYELYNDSQHARVCSCGAKTYESHTKLRTVGVSETQHGDYCRCGHTWNLKSHVWQKTGNDRICRVCGYLDMKLPGMSVNAPCDDIHSSMCV